MSRCVDFIPLLGGLLVISLPHGCRLFGFKSVSNRLISYPSPTTKDEITRYRTTWFSTLPPDGVNGSTWCPLVIDVGVTFRSFPKAGEHFRNRRLIPRLHSAAILQELCAEAKLSREFHRPFSHLEEENSQYLNGKKKKMSYRLCMSIIWR